MRSEDLLAANNRWPVSIRLATTATDVSRYPYGASVNSIVVASSTASTVTIGVAIWGAITGTAALYLNAVKEIRDRPNVEVGLSYGVDTEGPHWEVEVANHGRRPVTIVEVGLRIALDFEMETNFSGESISNKFEPKLWEAEGDPYLLASNEIRRHPHRPADWPSILLTAEMPVRAYAVDSYGATNASNARHMFLDFQSFGWKPRGRLDPGTKEKTSPIRPKPLAPRWKMWRPANERGPKQLEKPKMVLGPAQEGPRDDETGVRA